MGVLPVVQLPFHESEEIDFDGLCREIDWLLEQSAKANCDLASASADFANATISGLCADRVASSVAAKSGITEMADAGGLPND